MLVGLLQLDQMTPSPLSRLAAGISRVHWGAAWRPAMATSTTHTASSHFIVAIISMYAADLSISSAPLSCLLVVRGSVM